MTTLVDLYENNKVQDKGWCYTDKWYPFHSYFGYYDKELAEYKKNVRMLEIGVCWGSSINIFAKYFDEYKIDGVDITTDWMDRSGNYNKEIILANPNVNLHMDVNSRDVERANALYDNETFDVIIEDGDHSIEAQYETFVAYFPKTKKSGKYFIEDILDHNVAFLKLRLENEYPHLNVEHYLGSIPRGDDNILKITYKA